MSDSEFIIGVFEAAYVVCQFIVGSFGIVIAALSIWGIVVPERLIGMVTGVMARPAGMRIAVGARFLLGFALLVAASGGTWVGRERRGERPARAGQKLHQ